VADAYRAKRRAEAPGKGDLAGNPEGVRHGRGTGLRVQVLVFRWVYPVEAMITAVILAILPYTVVRGVVNRLARTWMGPQREATRS
jgi:hypothetical protein